MSEPPEKIRWAPLVRWLHNYISLIGFATFLFFSVTGITLNHAEFFEGEETVLAAKGSMPPAIITKNGSVDRLAVVEWLRKHEGARGEVTTFDDEGGNCTIILKAPASAMDVQLERESGNFTITRTTHGWIAWLDDLHKGRDSGAAWSLVIDISAGLMALASLTGLWLLFYIKIRRKPGLIVTAIGLAVLCAVAFLFIP